MIIINEESSFPNSSYHLVRLVPLSTRVQGIQEAETRNKWIRNPMIDIKKIKILE